MNTNKVNHDIRCRVESCQYHSAKEGCCTLSSIHVEPCVGCGNGRASDESMCGSYEKK